MVRVHAYTLIVAGSDNGVGATEETKLTQMRYVYVVKSYILVTHVVCTVCMYLQVSLHLQSPAHFYPGLSGFLMGLDSIETHRDSTIEELKALILTLPAVS